MNENTNQNDVGLGKKREKIMNSLEIIVDEAKKIYEELKDQPRKDETCSLGIKTQHTCHTLSYYQGNLQASYIHPDGKCYDINIIVRE